MFYSPVKKLHNVFKRPSEGTPLKKLPVKKKMLITRIFFPDCFLSATPLPRRRYEDKEIYAVNSTTSHMSSKSTSNVDKS